MVNVSYGKLKRIATKHPAYRMIENGDNIEVLFYPPTEESASSTSEFESSYGETVIRVIGLRRGDVVEITDAFVESGGTRRRLSLDELSFWVNEIEWLA
ncbi:hypothetical protein [Caldivirga maquilingensis]|uniref:Uncharacterized protein n=1 Tax=Caldivirga maquilingensis (strain ATCC 700844 / DSM 13496 / JCM 10307 / IC-167) TaxID=397948 RepID=A8MB47_CALMQ|nr:hypothetical protein [Caldivirga maquilingensis]ABW02676.1 conserved hypothetical protein [Caldivirga maquilingensis IC-167]